MRAALESLLRARKLDVTLTPFGPDAVPLTSAPDEARVAPTGVTALDAALGGGLRRGHLSDVAGASSSGRTTLVVRALAAATARGEAAALVDASDTFDPASAAAHGVALSHLLWVRPGGHDVTIAIRAYSLVLQAGGFGLVVLDLADVAPAALRRLPATTWMRLSRIVEGSDTAALLVGADRIARSAGGVTIACEAAAAGWQGTASRARVFTGLAAAPRVVGGRR
jgi:recA bacterial DNA recombination protein